MNDQGDSTGGPIRILRRLAKWDNNRTPDDGPPDSIDEAVFWSEDGQEITDPVRIAALEQLYGPQEE